MKILFSSILMFTAYALFATAPLDGGYNIAPRPSASAEEKNLAIIEARNRVINTAEKYLNTPYRYGGMSSTGMDCSGLICISFREALGVNLPRSASGLYSWAEKIPLDKAQPGDLLFFKTDNSGRITHVALYLGGRRFIHAASVGARTGVIYTSLDEGSWSRTFAGAGRALPEVSQGYQQILTSGRVPSGGSNTGSRGQNESTAEITISTSTSTSSSSKTNLQFIYGVSIAPTWNGFLKGGNFLRGFSSNFRVGADTKIFGPQMMFGLELRPEYDGALGVFRIPLTMSCGYMDKFSIFAGPVLSIGSASLSTAEGQRNYSGGTSWLGTIGINAAPFSINSQAGNFAPYFEAAWQSYKSDNSNSNLNADFSANFRFSTGLRWTMQFSN